jgi:osmotically-inducible protein OsmY
MKTRYVFIFAMVSVFVFQVMAFSQNVKKAEPTPQSMIEHRLTQKGLLANNNIQVSVAGSVVTLQGEVPTIYAKKQAEREVKNVEEAFSVVNDLTVKFSSVPDSVLASTVQDRINRYVFYSIFDWVTVEANNGTITLKGWGHLPWTMKQIQSVVEKIKNVQKIDNQIQFVQGPDDIRYHAARAIYSDPLFEYYAYTPDPPIHIIVKGPDIILEGKVYNDPDKSWAGVLAEFNTDAINVVNNIQIIKK